MTNEYNDIGPCPICGSEAWLYTEVGKWNGRQCQVCEGIFIHDDVGLKDPDDR